MTEKSLSEIDFSSLMRRTFTPSPAAWEDQILYFLLVDRFSNGEEKGGYRDNHDHPVMSGRTPLYTEGDPNRIEYDRWLGAAGEWQGGNLAGLATKLGYLKRMGISAIWVSPIFRQVSFEPSYHGYGIQNFLDVDPHFGTREQFREFVEIAHDLGIYVILDIIANHTGNVFSYAPDRYLSGVEMNGEAIYDARWDGKRYAVRGFNDRAGRPTLPPDSVHPDSAWPDGGVWPREFQNLDLFMRKGHISNWDYYPEYIEADLYSLRTLDLWARPHGSYRAMSPALAALIVTYCFWIAYADLDGFRIDAAKHMTVESLRVFCDAIREFAEAIGKEHFLLLGEVTGGRGQAWELVAQAGLDAALGIEDEPGRLERMVTGKGEPADYFAVFRNRMLDEPNRHRWYRNSVVTLIDDHDQVRKGSAKARFCAEGWRRKLAFNAVAAQLTTMGIPCIYYGTEQGFDSGNRSNSSDLVLRENMFGGRFGGKKTQDRHFFNEQEPLYKDLSSLAELRRDLLPLRRGRQFLHEVSGDGVNFGLPTLYGERIQSIVSWSRCFVDEEVLVALSTNLEQSLTMYSTVAPLFRATGDRFELVFWHSPDRTRPPSVTVVEQRGNCFAVKLTLPPAGFAIYKAPPGLARLRGDAIGALMVTKPPGTVPRR